MNNKDKDKDKELLIAELEILRKRVEELEFAKQSLTISEEKRKAVFEQVEEKLWKSEKFSKQIIESMAEGFSILNEDGVHIDVNRAFCKMTGFEKEELIGIGVPHPYWPEEEYENIQEAFVRTSKGEFECFELILKKKNGDRFPALVTPSRVKDESGNTLINFATIVDITERKQAQQKLNQSTLLLEASQSIAKLGGWELDLVTNSLFWTAETYRIHDTSPEEFDPTVDAGVGYFLPESRRIISSALEMAMKNGEGYDLELETYTTKGRLINVRTTCVVQKYDGKPTKLTGIFQDITDRKQAEEVAQINEKYYENIINSMGDPVFVKDSESRLLLVNDAFCGIFGLPRDQIIGKTLAEEVPASEQEEFLKIDKQVLFDGKDNINEETLTVRGGETRIISTRKTRFTDTNSNKFLVGVIRDVSEIKKQEIELQHLRNYLTNIINSMPSILIGVDNNSTITQWNNTAEQKMGIATESALHKPLIEVIPSLADEIERIKLAIQSGTVQSNQNQVLDEQGNTRCENITIYPLTTNDAEGAVILIDDVTKEYEVEQELNQARKMDAIGQLAGGVAHDFNNMLGVITAAAGMIQKPERNLDEKALKFVEMICTAADRSAELTKKLLAFGRKGNILSTPTDIHSIIEDTVAIFNRTIDKKVNIVVLQNAHNSMVIGDESALQNAILNLGLNASQAMPDGGELVIETRDIYLNETYCTSSTFHIEPGDYIEIDVRDTGCGIAFPNTHKIFEPFFTTKKQGEGTGLGLASVYGTIQDHHGTISVTSEIGVGSVFQVCFPCSVDAVKEVENKKSQFRGTGQVLLVDDEELIRITAKDSLEDMGYTVFLAENGLEALDLFTQKHLEIDVVIMDMIMPVMNGSEAFFKMKEIDAYCSIIISSGYTKDENLNELREAGLAGFIQKPFRNEELGQLLSDVAKKSKGI
ncbi:MAG: PAS domain S-box protein [Fibrobacterales bacterium]